MAQNDLSKVQQILAESEVPVEAHSNPSDGSITYTRKDSQAGLTDAEKQEISMIESSTDAEERKMYIMKEKFPEDYLEFETGDSVKDKAMEDIALVVKMTTPSYLNSLSQEELNDLCDKYVEFAENHTFDHAKGSMLIYTKDQLDSMTDAQIEEAYAYQAECVNTFNSLVEQQYIDFNNMKGSDKNGPEAADEADNNKGESAWSKLKNNVTAMATAVSNWFKSTAVGEWVMDKYEDIFGKDEESRDRGATVDADLGPVYNNETTMSENDMGYE